MPDTTTVPTPPARLALRPRDRHGRIVPAFVEIVEGQPDHRVMRKDFVQRAHERRLCFLCELPLGIFGAFVVDPARTVTRASPEPPSHRTCAEYAAHACLFLTDPDTQPDEADEPDGTTRRRNFGVCAVYTTDEWSRQRGRELFSFRHPFSVTWWTHGRPATYPEALAALVSGRDVLRAQADEDDNPARAHELLVKQYERALELLPGNAS